MSKKVLIVDDEPNIVLSLEFLMEEAGYNVRSVTDGEKALDAVRQEVPDLILLDIMLPKRDGYEVCREIRANPDWKKIRIIMLTAKGREVDQEKGIAFGADEYIT
ncbi:MAG: response regulator, partial [bacterium]|nr:response regulator [bacterium]